uniref:ABM domain-containing protein n=1 Tax=Theileria annulata TaxID=5874 RepID=A0A3B0MZY7_THEAN
MRIRPLENLKEIILDLLDWYKYATLKQQHATMLFSGAFLGLIVGRTQHKRRMKSGEFSRDFELVAYKVEDEKKFEENWNRLALLAQKQPGYKYTKLYKACYPDRSPIHYFKLRLWRNKEDLENFRNLEQYKVLRKNLDESSSKVRFGSTKVIIDDTVRREIPYRNTLFY